MRKVIKAISESFTEESRADLIKDPNVKKRFVALQDIMTEFLECGSGNSRLDKRINSLYSKFIETGDVASLDICCQELFRITGNSNLK